MVEDPLTVIAPTLMNGIGENGFWILTRIGSPRSIDVRVLPWKSMQTFTSFENSAVTPPRVGWPQRFALVVAGCV